MTSIYQIIEQRGEMDDYNSRVYASYMSLDRALIDLQMLQELEDVRIEHGKMCQRCLASPNYDCPCPRADFKGGECENFDLHQELYNYFIESIDVIE